MARTAIAEQRLSLPAMPRDPFHRNLANHLLAGEPLAVRPRSSRRNIAVMEAAVHSAAHDAEIVRPAPATTLKGAIAAEALGQPGALAAANGRRRNSLAEASGETGIGMSKSKRNGTRA